MILYLILRDGGEGFGTIFASGDEATRDDLLARLRAAIEPGDIGVEYEPDCIEVGSLDIAELDLAV